MTEGADSDIDFSGGPTSVSLPDGWNHGSRAGRTCTDPPLQVHRVDPHTAMLRQSKAETYEAPFLYLLFGNTRALLLDTGAVAERDRMPLRDTVDDLVARWLAEHPRPSYHLVVAHTHGHGDHVAGDVQFADRPHTTVVGREPSAVQEHFGFTQWPRETVSYDLGGRTLEVTGIPGHHRASIAIYDPWTGFLLTGDTVYPGRLYVQDMAAFTDSVARLLRLAESRGVRAVMGAHIEMSRTPGRDYPRGTTYQPQEPPLQMGVDRLRAVRDAAELVAGSPGAHWYDDFAIFNGRCRAAFARQRARRIWARLCRT